MTRHHRRGIAAPSLLLSLLLSLAGCSAPDYSAMRDWARTAQLAADVPSLGTAAGSRGDGLLAMQEALTIYLGALGIVAADGVLPYRDDPFVALAARAGLVNEAGARAVATLGAQLRRATRSNAQAPELSATIVAADPSVQALVAALSAEVGEKPPGEAAARAATAAAYEGLIRDARTAPRQQPIRDLAALRDRQYAERDMARAHYVAVLAGIAEGHAIMKARAGHLGQAATARQVRAAEDQLRRAAALLPRAIGPVAQEGAKAPRTAA